MGIIRSKIFFKKTVNIYSNEIGVISLILHVRKLRHREVRYLVQPHPVCEWQRQNLKPESPVLEFMLT